MKHLTFGFIGLGLIGGSLAKGLKRADKNHHIMAFARHRSTLESALKDGVIDEALEGIDENLRRCDYIFLCTPVSFNEAYLSAVRPYLREDAILTDVGSVKTNIHEAVEKLGMEANFIGGHPMAGSEKKRISVFHRPSCRKRLLYHYPDFPVPGRKGGRIPADCPFSVGSASGA